MHKFTPNARNRCMFSLESHDDLQRAVAAERTERLYCTREVDMDEEN